MNLLISNRLSAAVAAGAALALAPAAHGQDAPAPAVQTVTVTDAQLRSFASAIVDLHEIDREVSPRLEAADEEAKVRIRARARERMTAAVRERGLDPQTFNQIAAAAEEDPQLAQQITEYVQEEAAGR